MRADLKLGPEFTRALWARECAEDIADLAGQVAVHRLDIHHAAEKLAYALFRSAEALALCGLPVEAVVAAARRGAVRGQQRREEMP